VFRGFGFVKTAHVAFRYGAIQSTEPVAPHRIWIFRKFHVKAGLFLQGVERMAARFGGRLMFRVIRQTGVCSNCLRLLYFWRVARLAKGCLKRVEAARN
jgi:hypothetical protein